LNLLAGLEGPLQDRSKKGDRKGREEKWKEMEGTRENTLKYISSYSIARH